MIIHILSDPDPILVTIFEILVSKSLLFGVRSLALMASFFRTISVQVWRQVGSSPVAHQDDRANLPNRSTSCLTGEALQVKGFKDVQSSETGPFGSLWTVTTFWKNKSNHMCLSDPQRACACLCKQTTK